MPEFRPVLELSSLNGRNGFQISGAAMYDGSGFSVASAGDVNGDGFADVIIGARFVAANGPESGASYVIFGGKGSVAANLDLSGLDGGNGFRIGGEAAYDVSGFSVASAGDVNGDGFADVIIGAPFASADEAFSGASYVVFGKAGGFTGDLDLSSLDGNKGFKVSGVAEGDFSGYSVASAGDVNGDGFDDVVIGALFADPNGYTSGAAYVVFGKPQGFAANLRLSSLDGSNGFRISGAAPSDRSGNSVASAGDVNGDGIDDVIVGAYENDANGPRSGAAYVVFGQTGNFAANLDVTSLNGRNGFKISGEAEDDLGGRSVGPAGDVNGDGFADLIIGAPSADANGLNSGASYVVFGAAGGFPANLQLSSLNGANGFQISGATDFSGLAVAPAGDVNGDGFDDVMIGTGSLGPGGSLAGISYVVFGRASFAANLQLAGLDGNNGFQVNGEAAFDLSGRAVAAAGDVNNDGFGDVIVGAAQADGNARDSGVSYVIFGHRAFDAVNRVGTAGEDTINGGRGDDTIRGHGGNDRLIAWEGNDLVFGNGGRDRLNGRMGHDRLIGGLGPDVLIGGLGNDVFDFNAVTDSGTTDISRDVIRDFTHLEDRIDLSDLGALAFIGTAAFTAPGQVRVIQQGPNTIVEINLSGDAAPEMTIALLDVSATSLTQADFIL